MFSRTALRNVLIQRGRLPELLPDPSTPVRQNRLRPRDLFFYSAERFVHGRILLWSGNQKQALQHSIEVLRWARRRQPRLPLAIGVGNLLMGECLLAEGSANPHYHSYARRHLEQAVKCMREGGAQELIVCSLLGQATLFRETKDWLKAETNLQEVLSITTRGGMRLYQADCHLGYTRLHLARGDREKARDSLVAARKMIQEMGYHRRDNEVEELEGIL